MIDSLDQIIEDVIVEVNKVEHKCPGYNSPHEGYAVILEEVDELWGEVKKNGNNTEPYNYRAMYIEATHVACTAIRFMKMVRGKMDAKGIL